jgi:eukaryotic-like serine/threonine-protein kinase
MPEAIAHYTILDHVGRGGLGELYRARDTRLGRTVALRVLPASLVDPPESLENLVRVARSAAALSHPNVAALFEIGADGARHYLAFEYVSGELLSTKLRGRPLEVRSAVDFAIQLADALAKGEEQQLSHGDIRPETIVITSKGRPKLIHYGLSEFTSSGIARRASAPSPAPTEGTDREGALRDIRALGLVIYEMLTGRPPAASQPASAAASPAAVNTAVPSEVDRVVRRALSEDPKERYQTAATVAAELRAVAAILDARAAAAGAAEALDDETPRHGWALVAILLLTALAALVWWILRLN